MEKRYENTMKDLLETVAYEGFASVSKWKVTRWYGQSNFTVTIRRDLRERWKSLTEEDLSWEKAPTLRIAEVNGGGTIILMTKDTFYKDSE